MARQTTSSTIQCSHCVVVEEELWNCLMRDMCGCLCHCSAQLRIIYHNRSTWCSKKARTEQELEHHNQSVLANKEGEYSNIFFRICRCSSSHLTPAPLSSSAFPSFFQPLLTCLHLPMLICCFSDTHHWGSHF